MKTPSELKNEALAALRGNWAPAVVATVVFALIAVLLISPSEVSNILPMYGLGVPPAIALIALPCSLVMIFAMMNIEVGYYNSFRPLVDSGDANLTSNMFSHGFSNYWHKLGGVLLYVIIVILGFCLFIIPGIILTFAYAMVPYILDERPELSVLDTLRASRHMMKGHKFDLFYFWLTFIGWGILSLLTLGIGFIWLMPYYCTARAAFYNDVKAIALSGERFM